MRNIKPLLIDYGHGGLIDGVYQTPGGKQYTFTDVSPELVLYEGVSNRKTAAALMRLAHAAGIPVFDVVADMWCTDPVSWEELEQHDISLQSRVLSANKHPDGILISCHSNAIGTTIRGPSQAANGIDIYTYYGESGADPIATAIWQSFKDNQDALRVRSGNWSDGDPDCEAGFYILRKTSMPAVLGEIGFFTNLHDAQYLADLENHETIAACYWYGVRDYVGVQHA